MKSSSVMLMKTAIPSRILKILQAINKSQKDYKTMYNQIEDAPLKS